MGNKLLINNFSTFSELNKYAQIDKGSQNQWLDHTLQQNIQSQWANVTDENLYYRTQYGKFTLYRNSITLQEVEKYKIVLKDRDHFNKFCNLIKWKNNCQYLPKVQHFIVQNKTQICVSQFQVNLFIQRIPLRLADLTDIPFPQNLYFMTAMLKGYKYIFGSSFNVKVFNPTQSMIGVNREGEVKVWWSENLSALQAVESNQVFISEQNFVNGIIDMVEENTDQREYPYPFKRYLSERNIPINGDFNFVINQIYNYAKQMKVIIPKYAFSVREILTRDMFENTKLYSQNSLASNNFQTINKQIQRQGKGKQNISAQNVKKNEILITSNQNMFNQTHSENISNHNLQNTGQFKSNQCHVTFNGGSLERHNPRENNFNRHNEIQQRNSENKINQGIYQMGTNRMPSVQQVNFSINSNYSFNKLGKNVVQFANKAYEPHQNFISQIQKQKHSEIIFNNKFIPHSNPIQFKNPRMVQNNSNPVRMPQQNHSGIIFARNTNNSVSFNTAQHSHSITKMTPSIDTQNLPHSRNRHNSYHIPSTYQNEPPSQFSHLIHQNSTPVFPQTLRPQQLSTKVLIQRSNRAPSSSISQNSHINQYAKQQQIISNQNNYKAPSINESITKNPGEALKLKYFTKKDSQQTMDPQIVADLAKYLNHT